jgi:hypothetical protein
MVVCVPNRQGHQSSASSREVLQNLTRVHHQDQHKPLHALGQNIKKNKDLFKNLQGWQQSGRARQCGDDLNALIAENKKMTTLQNSMSMVLDYKVLGRAFFFVEYDQHSHATMKLCIYFKKVEWFHRAAYL